jgi:hypothetical protein
MITNVTVLDIRMAAVINTLEQDPSSKEIAFLYAIY